MASTKYINRSYLVLATLFAGTVYNFKYIVYGVLYENFGDGTVAGTKGALVLNGAHVGDQLQCIDARAGAVHSITLIGGVAMVGASASMDVGDPILSKTENALERRRH